MLRLTATSSDSAVCTSPVSNNLKDICPMDCFWLGGLLLTSLNSCATNVRLCLPSAAENFSELLGMGLRSTHKGPVPEPDFGPQESPRLDEPFRPPKMTELP